MLPLLAGIPLIPVSGLPQFTALILFAFMLILGVTLMTRGTRGTVAPCH